MDVIYQYMSLAQLRTCPKFMVNRVEAARVPAFALLDDSSLAEEIGKERGSRPLSATTDEIKHCYFSDEGNHISSS